MTWTPHLKQKYHSVIVHPVDDFDEPTINDLCKQDRQIWDKWCS